MTPTMFAFLFIGMALIGSELAKGRSIDPCGGAKPVFGTKEQGGTAGGENANEALKQITSSSAEAVSLARNLKMKYNNNSREDIRISNNMAQWVSTFHLDNFPHKRNSGNVNVTLQRDYDDVSTIAVFHKSVHWYERTSSNPEFTHEMDDFETSLYHTLCKIKMAALKSGLEINITRDVMNINDENLVTTSNRYIRDYVVFRDAEAFLEGLSNGY